MLPLDFIEHSGFFTKVSLQTNEILFKQGDIDEFIYIIASGRMSVESVLINNEIKNFAILGKNSLFGEGSLNHREPKEVQLRSLEESVLYKIHGKDGITSLLESYPKQGLILLKQIINISNKRLLEANSQISANYQISHQIANIGEINLSSITELLQSAKNILQLDYIVYIEKNPVVDNYYTLKYDTRNQGKISDTILELSDITEILKYIDNNTKYNSFQKLNLGNIEIGYLILGKQINFSDAQNKIILSIITSISGIIRQKLIIDDERNKGGNIG